MSSTYCTYFLFVGPQEVSIEGKEVPKLCILDYHQMDFFRGRYLTTGSNSNIFSYWKKTGNDTAQCSGCQLGCSNSKNFPCISGSCYRSIFSKLEFENHKNQYFSWLLKSEHVKTNIFGNRRTKLTI